MGKATRSILRSKTGCLTCRQRRMKCDEALPICGCCIFSRRKCQWPTAADLLDRRFASHCQSRHRSIRVQANGAKNGIEDSDQPREEGNEGRLRTIPNPNPYVLSESGVAHRAASRHLEFVISRHFVERYCCLTLLPSCHPDFYDRWLREIQNLMVSHRSVYYSVLACAASHIYLIDANSPMQELAITYYSNAIKDTSTLLATTSHLERHNALLVSVIFLYIHGCIGQGTYADVPRHVKAATQILKLWHLKEPVKFNRLLDRLAIESILYQVFLTTMGLWSDFALHDFNFDSDVWAQGESLLNRWRPLFPGSPTSFNSPVLGIPVSLFRTIILLRQQWQTPLSLNPDILKQIQIEVESWEFTLLCEQEPDFLGEDHPKDQNSQEKYYKDAGWLYIIIASLLLEQLPRQDFRSCYPRKVPCNNWRIRTAIRILEQYNEDDGWARFFISNWPVYTLGVFISSDVDKRIIEYDLKRRWELTRFAQNTRFSQDLASIWDHESKGAPILYT
ncbi:hypothetical protein GGI35DRAFT_442807 [Trichoderma velutinum]